MTTPHDLRNVDLTTGPADGLALDVAVVGAGMGGLYTAWRLTGANPDSAVQVFESSDRITGRIDSVVLPYLQIPGELGGMRYTDGHVIVSQLVAQVFADELTKVPFPMGDDAHHFNYLRKQRLVSSAWTDAQAKGELLQTKYDLDEGDVGLNANQLFNKIIYRVFEADPWFMANYADTISYDGKFNWEINLTNEQWDAVKPKATWHLGGPLEGKLLNDIGFWNLLSNIVSEEGFEFLDAAGGYYSNTMNWNCAEAFPNQVSDFTSQPDFHTIEGGYDLQGYALAQAFLKTPNAAIRAQTTLRSFAPAKDGPKRYALTFRDECDGGKEWTAYADRIVLAMPRRSLELLDQDAPFFQDATLQHNIQSVLLQPSFKVLMAFEEPWWKEEFQATAGESITDLPLRQCYYFGTDPDDTHSLMLASYNDMRTVTFWQPLAADPEPFEFSPTQLVSAEDLQHPEVSRYQASKLLVDEVLRQLREVHGDNPVPDPLAAWFMDWSVDPFGGGYHAWAARYSVPDVMPYMRQPDPNEGIHIVGEAYSDQQGWVEGAYCVCERMLQEHFGLAWPEWLPKDYYLGH